MTLLRLGKEINAMDHFEEGLWWGVTTDKRAPGNLQNCLLHLETFFGTLQSQPAALRQDPEVIGGSCIPGHPVPMPMRRSNPSVSGRRISLCPATTTIDGQYPGKLCVRNIPQSPSDMFCQFKVNGSRGVKLIATSRVHREVSVVQHPTGLSVGNGLPSARCCLGALANGSWGGAPIG